MPLWAALCLTGAFAFICRNWQCGIVSAVLLLDWYLGTAVVDGTGDVGPWAAFWLIDMLAAVAVILVGDRLKAWQVIIAVLFAEMVGCHTIYAASQQSGNDYYTYWWRLHYLAWAQLWVAALWGLSDAVGSVWRVYVRNRLSRSDTVAARKEA